MKNEGLCTFLTDNICCVIMPQCELGIEPIFWQNEPKEDPNVLPMSWPG